MIHEACKDVAYIAVMTDLLVSSSENQLSPRDVTDLRNLFEAKAELLLSALDAVTDSAAPELEEKPSGIIS